MIHQLDDSDPCKQYDRDRTDAGHIHDDAFILTRRSCNVNRTCPEVTSSPNDCDGTTTMIFSNNTRTYETFARQKISLDCLAAKLINAYWQNLDDILQETQQFHETGYPKVTQIWRRLGNDALHTITILMALILLTIGAYLHKRWQQRIDDTEYEISNLNNILIA